MSKAKHWKDAPTNVIRIDADAAAASRARQAERVEKKAATAKRSKPKKRPPVRSVYQSKEWKIARYKALKRSDGRCQCCGAGPKQGAVLNVDHIVALSKRPDLALKQSNLQVLCASCNEGKGWRDETNWRDKPE